MNPIRHIHRIAGVLAGLAGLAAALLASGATPASAKATPGPPQPYPGANLPPAQIPAQIHTVTRTVVVGGMPGWQIALIAAAAALLAATVAVLVDRARSAHRQAAMLAA